MNPSVADFQGTDRFQVVRRIGAGGFGVVYEALDRDRNARVALKIFHSSDAAQLYRLKKEFRSLAEISHPNLVSLYELLSHGGYWFFTMELLQGTDFIRFVRPESKAIGAAFPSATVVDGLGLSEAPTGLPAAIRIDHDPASVDYQRLRAALAQLADGLNYLHSVGKLHRDIKSANVMVMPAGRVVLLDFGLVTDVDTGATEQSMPLVGTPAYMSPEQLDGAPATAAADWYAVGVLMFLALTGRYPFVGGPLEVCQAKREVEPPEARDLFPQVPEDLNSLCHELMARDPARRPGGDEFLTRLHSRPATASAVDTSVPVTDRHALFVGRQSELAALQAAYTASQNGHAITMYLHGTSGVGKTALVRHFLRELQRDEPDTLILTGRCYERESVPYKALDSLIDALSRYLRDLSPADVEHLLPRDITPLARLFPVLHQVEAISSSRRRVRSVPESQELRRRAFAAFRELLDRIGDERPVVLFIDDLQWGDADSAALLAAVMEPPDPPPVLLLVSYRSEEASRILLRSLLQHHRDPTPDGDVRELEVRELTPTETRDLSRALIGTARTDAGDRAETVARESHGNPFFINELARFSLEHGDATADSLTSSHVDDVLSVETVVRARVDALPEDARRLLELLAVFGAPLDVRVARRAADLRTGELQALAVLRARRLIRTRMGEVEAVETYHDRIRETVSSALPGAIVRSHHRRLAEALEGAGHPDPETLAVHFHGAGLESRAAQYAVLAATQASDAMAFDRAARLYRFALELEPDDRAGAGRLQNALGNALAYGGRGYEAAQAYLAAAAATETSLEQLELRRCAGEQLLRSGHIDQGFSVLNAVMREIGIRLDITPRRALLSLFWHRMLIRLTGLRFQERDPSTIAPLQLFKVDACWSVALHVGMINTIRGADFQARGLLLACRVGDLRRIARAVAAEVPYSATAGTRAEGRTKRLLNLAEQLARRLADPYAMGFVHVFKGMTANMHGRWKESLEIAERAEEMLRETARGMAWELDLVYLYSLLDLQFMGELPELRRRLERFLKEARERDDLNAITNLRTRLAYLPYLAADDPDRARSEALSGFGQWSQDRFRFQHYYALFAEVEVMLYTGDGMGAWRAVISQWGNLKRSLILHSHNVRVEALQLRARAALAAACQCAPDTRQRSRFLRIADRQARSILNEKAPWAVGQALLVRAGVAATRRRLRQAADYLVAAERASVSQDMNLHAAAARRRQGELSDGEAGTVLVRDAEQWMTSREIRNPVRMTALLAPGEYVGTR